MKKTLLLFALILPLIFCGCSNDDDDNSLEGTVWQYSDNSEGIEESGTLTFSKSTVKLVVILKGDLDGNGIVEEKKQEGTGTYIYDHPNVIIEFDGEKETLTVSGNKMTSTPDEDGDFIVFQKK